jgi:hypothetical protein
MVRKTELPNFSTVIGPLHAGRTVGVQQKVFVD